MNRRVTIIATLLMGMVSATATASPNFLDTIARPLRYQPRGTDFVTVDGAEGKASTKETFNRPLYGSGTAFRVDAGDRPEFSLFLPGRGGVLRLGVRRGDHALWLIDAESIEAVYRPGSMLYSIRDPILGEGELRLTVMVSFVDEALLAKIEFRRNAEGVAANDIELIAAFGGASGERGSRNGDIGTEKLPVREFFQLKPEHCKDNRIEIAPDRFTLTAKTATLIGRSQPAMNWSIADAEKWASPTDLLASAASDIPVVVGRVTLKDAPVFIRIDRRAHPTTQPNAPLPREIVESDFEADLAESELLRGQIANRVKIDTPDAYLNAAVAALNIGAEGTWDTQQKAVMHGAVAWRNKLLGWRGAYWLDALGEHDRLRQHLNNWLPGQNVDPIPPQIPPAEASANLSRNEDALHSNGNLTDNHYDMNLVAFDALFRHLLWTGDLDYAKQVWPTIERHLAWEQRMFRREFGAEKLPLYEGYACIWASDDLWYNGGGATHSSAYNAFHNRMAARIAKAIGVDPMPYEQEATAIERAMREHLWLNDTGHFAEWKDLLGEGLVHPDAAAWTVYHSVDSRIATPTEAWQLARYAATALPRLPITGENVPEGTFQIATTDWFPYQWSTNNVVMAESAHTALAMLQANRTDDGFALLKGAILDSMYMGQCPGNVGMATPLDMARSESQRDFADGCGALSRAIVEGLYGITPDALDGTLTIAPRFPATWDRARLDHPSVHFAFTRSGDVDTFELHPRTEAFKHVELIVPAPRDSKPTATVDDQPVAIEPVLDSVGVPRYRLRFAATGKPQTVRITWTGKPIQPATREFLVVRGHPLKLKLEVDEIERLDDPESVTLDSVTSRNGFLSAVVTGLPGRHTLFAKVRQGEARWVWPIELDVREPIEILSVAEQTPGSIAFTVRNNRREKLPGDVWLELDGKRQPLDLSLGAHDEKTFACKVDAPGTHRIVVGLGDRVIGQGAVADFTTALAPDVRLDSVDLSTIFNDRITQIFRNEYLAPRSPFVSLAVPKQGIGSWCKPAKQFDVDDSGLRALAGKSGGIFTLPNGIRFATPASADAKNSAFVSQWSNYPKSIALPLTGHARRAYLLMAGSTQSMQSRFDNGEVIVTYTDGSTDRLALRNPETWWPIDQDYAIDDFAFRYTGAIPPRIDLKTGTIRIRTLAEAKGKGQTIEGGAATVLDLPLDPQKKLKSLTVRAIANEVVIGLLGVTLQRE